LTDSITDSIVAIDGYTLFRADRADGRRGGGVCIYLKTSTFESFKIERLTMSVSGIDALWLKLSSATFSFTIAGIYRPPSSSTLDDVLMISDLQDSCERFQNLLVFGDFNFPGIN
jgi:hypothetical protein